MGEESKSPLTQYEAAKQCLEVNRSALFWQELRAFPYKQQMGSQLRNQDKQALMKLLEHSPSKPMNDVEYLKKSCTPMSVVVLCPTVWTSQAAESGEQKRPQKVHEVRQGPNLASFWCAVAEAGPTGLFSFENDSFNGERHKRTLRFAFFRKLQEYPQKLVFQQDGAPHRCAHVVLQYLHEKLEAGLEGTVQLQGYPTPQT